MVGATHRLNYHFTPTTSDLLFNPPTERGWVGFPTDCQPAGHAISADWLAAVPAIEPVSITVAVSDLQRWDPSAVVPTTDVTAVLRQIDFRRSPTLPLPTTFWSFPAAVFWGRFRPISSSPSSSLWLSSSTLLTGTLPDPISRRSQSILSIIRPNSGRSPTILAASSCHRLPIPTTAGLGSRRSPGPTRGRYRRQRASSQADSGDLRAPFLSPPPPSGCPPPVLPLLIFVTVGRAATVCILCGHRAGVEHDRVRSLVLDMTGTSSADPFHRPDQIRVGRPFMTVFRWFEV